MTSAPRGFAADAPAGSAPAGSAPAGSTPPDDARAHGALAQAATTAVRHAPRPPALQPADPWRRLMSAVYESVLLFGIVFFFGYAFSALTTFRAEDGPLRNGFQMFLFLVLGAYFSWFWSEGRITLPMKTMAVGLRRARDGAPLSLGRAAWRYLVASLLLWGSIAAIWKASAWWLPLLPLPFAWAIFDPRRQTLYDRLAGTMLVRVDPALRRATVEPAPRADA